MNNQKDFVTIGNIAAEIYSHPMMRDLPFERIVGDTIELMHITGCPNLFEQKEEDIEIHNWRAMLPCDFVAINQLMLLEENNCMKPKEEEIDCSEKESNEKEETEESKEDNTRPIIIKFFAGNAIGENTRYSNKGFKIFKESTDTFSVEGSPAGRDLVYKIQGRVLYTSTKEAKVRISYKAIKLDEEGNPMILNETTYLRALKSYIKMNWFTILFDMGTIRGDVLANAQQEYYFNIAQAENRMKMPDMAEMENISRIMNDQLNRPLEFFNTFRDLNKQHNYKVH